jgi:hypothetical protein
LPEIIDLFLERAVPEPMSGCWLWMGSMLWNGYGRYKNVKAHRLAWEIFNGPVPSSLFVLHRCDTRLCVNPDHLFLGSTADNMADKVRKGRQAMGSKNGQSKLTEEQVRHIRELSASLQLAELAKKFGVCKTTIYYIVSGQRWSHA